MTRPNHPFSRPHFRAVIRTASLAGETLSRRVASFVDARFVLARLAGAPVVVSRVVAAPLVALALLGAPGSAETAPAGRAFVPIGQSQADAAQRPAPSVDRHGRPIIVNNGQIILVPTPSPAPPSAVHVHPPVFAPIAVPPGSAAAGLPLACIERVALHRGEISLMGAACLAEAGVDLRALPTRCAVAVQTRGPVFRGFDPMCLGAAGYRLAGR